MNDAYIDGYMYKEAGLLDILKLLKNIPKTKHSLGNLLQTPVKEVAKGVVNPVQRSQRLIRSYKDVAGMAAVGLTPGVMALTAANGNLIYDVDRAIADLNRSGKVSKPAKKTNPASAPPAEHFQTEEEKEWTALPDVKSVSKDVGPEPKSSAATSAIPVRAMRALQAAGAVAGGAAGYGGSKLVGKVTGRQSTLRDLLATGGGAAAGAYGGTKLGDSLGA